MRKTYESTFRSVWLNIKGRCGNSNASNYHLYGGRGIKCEWNNFKEFKRDMYKSYIEHKKKYPNNTSIDRIDSNGNYCLANCRWITIQEQQNNRRDTIIFTYKGITKTLLEWSSEFNLPSGIVRGRIRLGWTPERALITPVIKRQYVAKVRRSRIYSSRWNKTCPNGHVREGNTKYSNNGRRDCIVCSKLREKVRYATRRVKLTKKYEYK